MLVLTIAGCGRIDFDRTAFDGGTPDDGAPDFSIMLASHGLHSCRLDHQKLVCWGRNDNGQLGLGDASGHLASIVPGAWDRVWVGEFNTCARSATDHATYCWGSGALGQHSFGMGADLRVPTRTNLPLDVDQLVLGEAHGCALVAGAVTCWGSKECGRIDGADSQAVITPMSVPLASPAVELSAHDTETCARHADGTLTCWGTWDAQEGPSFSICGTSLGVGLVDVALPARALAIRGGCHGHSCAVLASGELACWGYNEYGQLGDGTELNSSTAPRSVSGFGIARPARLVAIGAMFTCATTDGDLYCWGENASGELGTGSMTMTNVPLVVPFFHGRKIDRIDAACFHVCAESEGTLYCWGSDTYDELGDGAFQDRLVPGVTTLP